MKHHAIKDVNGLDQAMIDRINELARKSKTVGLTEEERTEQQRLRDAYRAAFRQSLIGTLEHTVIVDKSGKVLRRVADAHKKPAE
jgi:uncharacterized protein YnzC (UPF0291/DUF896 family)